MNNSKSKIAKAIEETTHSTNNLFYLDKLKYIFNLKKYRLSTNNVST